MKFDYNSIADMKISDVINEVEYSSEGYFIEDLNIVHGAHVGVYKFKLGIRAVGHKHTVWLRFKQHTVVENTDDCGSETVAQFISAAAQKIDDMVWGEVEREERAYQERRKELREDINNVNWFRGALQRKPDKESDG